MSKKSSNFAAQQVIEQWGKEHMRTPYNYAQ
jgi:hypothetical protein